MAVAVCILAAGRGSRLSGDAPKWFAQAGGRTIADWQLDGLRRAAGRWERLLVVTGFRQELFDPAALGCELVPNAEWATRNNWHSLALALERLGAEGWEGSVVVLNSDLLIGPRVVERFLEAAATAVRSLLAVDAEAPAGPEQMKVAVEDGRVVDIGKSALAAPPAGEYVGLASLHARDVPALVAILAGFAADPARADEWYEAAFREAMRTGVEFGVFPVEPGRWVEVDDAADLERAQKIAALLAEER